MAMAYMSGGDRMRDSRFLEDIEDAALLMQYLYEGNTVTVKNAIGVPLEITMDEEGYIFQKNLNFPESPRHLKAYQLPEWLGIIDQLKGQPEENLADANTGNGFQNQWDEIRFITLANRSLRKVKNR